MERKIIMIEMDSGSLYELWMTAQRSLDRYWEDDLEAAAKELREELARHGLDPLQKDLDSQERSVFQSR